MKGKIVGVCACPVGVAHTYMAADKFTQVAKKMGYSIKVETQGMNGIEDYLSEQDLKEADWIVLANDIALRESERFLAYEHKTIKTTMSVILHNTKEFIEENLQSKGEE